MIHYQLRCDAEHGFDGWFRDSTAFDAQAKAGLLACPVCGDAKVSRALMTPAVGRKRERPAQVEVPAPAAVPAAAAVVPSAAASAEPLAVGALPDALRAMLQRMRAEVEKRCEYVGTSFAGEARRIHNGESDARGIYGEATPEEAERLADDGIEVARIPWVPRADG